VEKGTLHLIARFTKGGFGAPAAKAGFVRTPDLRAVPKTLVFGTGVVVHKRLFLAGLFVYDWCRRNCKQSQFRRFDSCADARIRRCLTIAMADIGVRRCAPRRGMPTERRISI
jgi:hypothetical protein